MIIIKYIRNIIILLTKLQTRIIGLNQNDLDKKIHILNLKQDMKSGQNTVFRVVHPLMLLLLPNLPNHVRPIPLIAQTCQPNTPDRPNLFHDSMGEYTNLICQEVNVSSRTNNINPFSNNYDGTQSTDSKPLEVYFTTNHIFHFQAKERPSVLSLYHQEREGINGKTGITFLQFSSTAYIILICLQLEEEFLIPLGPSCNRI